MSSAATDPLGIIEPQHHLTPYSLLPTVIRGLGLCAFVVCEVMPYGQSGDKIPCWVGVVSSWVASVPACWSLSDGQFASKYIPASAAATYHPPSSSSQYRPSAATRSLKGHSNWFQLQEFFDVMNKLAVEYNSKSKCKGIEWQELWVV